jgi:peptidoglycan hydrolase CwlO-like protein
MPLPLDGLIYLYVNFFTKQQECEKTIQQLQSQITALQSDRCVAEAALQRKDNLLMQAQQQWRNREEEWKHKLTNSNEEKGRLTAVRIYFHLSK